MVRMRKNKLELTIPAGSVRKYKKAGWELAEELKDSSDLEDIENVTENVDSQLPESNTEDDDSEDDEDVEYIDPEDLVNKPLEELDRDELKILAEYKGIDTTGLKSTKKLKAAIEALE